MIKKIHQLLASEQLPCWLLYSEEGSDPYFSQLISSHTSAPALALITPQTSSVLVSELEADNVTLSAQTYQNRDELETRLAEALLDAGYPDRIALTFSTLGDIRIDRLGYGTYRSLTNLIRRIYAKRPVRFVSAEALIYAYLDQKEPKELEKLALATRRAQEILAQTFQELRPGMTEQDIAELTRQLCAPKPAYLKGIKEHLAWEEPLCPIVLTGPNLMKGGHSLPSKRILEPGDTIYLDFGVSLTFSDGSTWTSDLQRMGYVLRKNEEQAPLEVQQVFETLYAAISTGMNIMRPGLPGWKIDQAVRKTIVSKGYPDYNHATGHAIGALAHNPGTLLGPRKRGLAKLPLRLHGVYTLEPRIAIPNGGSIEEMVHVTENGGVALSPRQEELFLVR